MSSVALPISAIVNVAVSIGQSAAQAQNTTTLLALTTSTQIDMLTRIAAFSSVAAVGTFFGEYGPEYPIAVDWFGQSPPPQQILFGRWAQASASGQLVCGPLTTAQQNIANFDAIADAGLSISVDGAGVVHIAGIVLTGVGNLNAVAAAINTAFGTAGLGCTCLWNGNNFVFTSATTGPTSSVSFLTLASGATDISASIGGQQVAGNGAYLSPGAAAETALAAVNVFDAMFGTQWYGLTIAGAADGDHLAIGPAIQAMSNKHFYWVSTTEAGVLVPASTTDIAYLLSRLNLTRTAVQYSSTDPYSAVSMAARILTVDYAASGSVLTLMFQSEPTVKAEVLNEIQMGALLAKNCNVFVTYQGGVTIIQPGTTTSTNQFIDTIIGVDNLALDIQTAEFNLLLQAITKIPQDDGGMHQFVATAETVCLEYVADGLIAPGTWTGSTFGPAGALVTSVLAKGYYIYAPPVASQLPSQRATRMAVPLQIAVKLAGAVQSVSATIFVNP